MKMLLLAGVAAATATAALAQAPAAESDAKSGGAYDPNETVCRSMRESGSRLKGARVCMTRAQWADLRRQQRLDTETSQNRRFTPR